MFRSLLFTTFMFVSAIPYSVVTLLVRPFGYHASYRVALSWTRMITGLLKKMCGLDFTVEGRENLPTRNSIVLMKHSSAYETLVQQLMFPDQCWVLKRELMWLPFFGWALAALHPIAINRASRSAAVRQIIEQGKQQLDSGRWVMIFPEGTRMASGQTRRYGISGVLLAQETGRLLVPVAHNAGDFWPRRGLRKHPGTVRFCIGPPVDAAGREPRKVNEEVQNWIETKIAEMQSATRSSDYSRSRAA